MVTNDKAMSPVRLTRNEAPRRRHSATPKKVIALISSQLVKCTAEHMNGTTPQTCNCYGMLAHLNLVVTTLWQNNEKRHCRGCALTPLHRSTVDR